MPSAAPAPVFRRHATAAALAALGLFALGSTMPVPLPLAGVAHAQFAPSGRAPLSFADIVERVKPAVVSIHVTSGSREPKVAQAPNQKGQPNTPRGPQGGFTIPGLPEDHPLNELFKNLPRGPQGGIPGLPSLAQGSGFIISEDGYVVTNNHVVENGNKIQVTLESKEKLDAELIGTDPRTDIALLKIKGNRKFTPVKFAAKDPRVGDWVLAVGNPFGFGGTVTAGIVSALARDLDNSTTLNDFLQIDAAVNRGNSGGPTFNLEGEVIGVNTAIYSPSGGNVGIAFAVPSRTVTEVVAQLRNSGSVSRGWLGVKIQNVDDDTAQALGLGDARGAVINEVTPGGPAQAAGLKTGDAVLSINGEKINDSRDLARKIAGFNPNTSIDVRVLRGGKEQTVAVKLGDFKNATGQPAIPAKADPGRPAPSTELSKLGFSLAAPGSAQAKAIKEGVVISDVSSGSDAATKGLKAGDVILDVSGITVNSAADMNRAVDEVEKMGRKFVLLRVKSGEAARFVPVQIKKG
jgi:serine protease Do